VSRSRIGALAWLLGLALVAGLIAAANHREVAAAIAVAGWSLALVLLVHLGTLIADTLGWRALLPAAGRPALCALVVKRWIGAAVNTLLPVAQLGGDFVRAQLLARSGVGGAVAGASVVVDVTAGLITQILFLVLGVGLFLARAHAAGWRGPLLGGLAVFGALVIGFLLAQRRGLFGALAGVAARMARGRAWPGLVGGAAALDRAIAAIYCDHAKLARCAFWRGFGWLWGSVEIWLAFMLLGHPIGALEAVILESLGQALRSLGFALPGGLGAQEGGIVAGGILLGMAPELAVAVALIKRARELAYGIAGLLVWSLTGSTRPAPVPKSPV
jgi:putative membrane protein